MYKCEQNSNPPLVCNIFTCRTKPKFPHRNESSCHEPLCRTNFSQYCILYCGVNLWKEIVVSKKLTFSDSDSLQGFKREVK